MSEMKNDAPDDVQQDLINKSFGALSLTDPNDVTPDEDEEAQGEEYDDTREEEDEDCEQSLDVSIFI